MKKIDEIKNMLGYNQAALIMSPANRLYFTDFKSSAGYIYITQNNAYFLIDSRYFETAKKSIRNFDVINTNRDFYNQINSINDKENIQDVYIENHFITIKTMNELKDKIKVNLITDDTLSEKIISMRIIKTSDEVEKIKQAQSISEKAYLEVLNFIKPGLKEIDVSNRLEFLMKNYGAEKVSFDLITITGKKTSVPHGSPDDSIIKEGDLFTFDIGCIYDGYCSDMTRTIAIGSADEKQREVYEIVLNAHLKARDAIKSGNKVSSVDLAAREYIEKCGYGEYFTHTTGHGVGIDIHEKPTVYKSTDMLLESNMVITDEPGIYIPEEFGVRIEDMYLVNDTGFTDLATISKELLVI